MNNTNPDNLVNFLKIVMSDGNLTKETINVDRQIYFNSFMKNNFISGNHLNEQIKSRFFFRDNDKKNP